MRVNVRDHFDTPVAPEALSRRALLVAHRRWMARERRGSRELCARAESFQDRLRQALAALAGKRKRLHDHRADFPFDIVVSIMPATVGALGKGIRGRTLP